MTQIPFSLPEYNPEVLDFLSSRRSNLAKNMSGPGPDADTLEKIMAIGARVPDHRKLAPWRFIVFEGTARESIGAHLGKVFKANNPNMPEDRVSFEAQRFLRAPVVIGVISSPVECARGTPEWEQRLSSAICCYNMCLAAQAHGFGAQWLTEWYAYDSTIHIELGLTEREQISGFIYIGTAKDPSLPRPRPELSSKISKYV